MDVRRCQIVSSSLRPCSRYRTGASSAVAAPVMPIWDDVACGRTTVIEGDRPRTSEKKSQRTRAMSQHPVRGSAHERALQAYANRFDLTDPLHVALTWWTALGERS